MKTLDAALAWDAIVKLWNTMLSLTDSAIMQAADQRQIHGDRQPLQARFRSALSGILGPELGMRSLQAAVQLILPPVLQIQADQVT